MTKFGKLALVLAMVAGIIFWTRTLLPFAFGHADFSPYRLAGQFAPWPSSVQDPAPGDHPGRQETPTENKDSDSALPQSEDANPPSQTPEPDHADPAEKEGHAPDPHSPPASGTGLDVSTDQATGGGANDEAISVTGQDSAIPAVDKQIANPSAFGAESHVDYDITVRLDVETRMLHGKQRMRFTNQSVDTIPSLQLHLYMNAFRNNQSTFFLEQEWAPSSSFEFGYIQLKQVLLADRALTWTPVQPDNDHHQDRTVAEVMLPTALTPGQSVEVFIDFEVKLPKGADRAGYHDDFFMGAQWFPKLGVWESAGVRGRAEAGWNCHQYHRYSEFYSDFGRYKVSITVPKDYQVGATGVMVGQDESENALTFHFQQDRVHDFAFAAFKQVAVFERTFLPEEWVTSEERLQAARVRQIDLADVAFQPVKMKLMLQPQHAGMAERHFKALAIGIKYFGLWYGRYPYETITVVDPPPPVNRTIGGMEYPTLITTGTSWPQLETYYDLEDLIIHEFAHQYWYGMVASNEFEEAFLDEGFTEYSASRLVDKAFGPSALVGKVLGVPFDLNRLFPVGRASALDGLIWSYRFYPNTQPITWRTWDYSSYWDYASNAYGKPAIYFHQLERILGEDIWLRVLATYFKRWQFRHPAFEDFVAVVHEVSGQDLSWFFQAYFHGLGRPDFAVTSIENKSVPEDRGYFDGDSGLELRGQEEDDGAAPDSGSTDGGSDEVEQWKSSFVVKNLGTGPFPLDINVLFDDGSQITEHWFSDALWTEFHYEGPAKLESVTLDPQGKCLIDTNRQNNSKVETPDPTAANLYTARFLVIFQNFIQTFGGGLL